MQAVQVTSQDMRAAISHEGRSMVPILQSIFQVCPAGSCCMSVQCGFLVGGVVCPACSTFSGSTYCALQFLLLRAGPAWYVALAPPVSIRCTPQNPPLPGSMLDAALACCSQGSSCLAGWWASLCCAQQALQILMDGQSPQSSPVTAGGDHPQRADPRAVWGRGLLHLPAGSWACRRGDGAAPGDAAAGQQRVGKHLEGD